MQPFQSIAHLLNWPWKSFHDPVSLISQNKCDKMSVNVHFRWQSLVNITENGSNTLTIGNLVEILTTRGKCDSALKMFG